MWRSIHAKIIRTHLHSTESLASFPPRNDASRTAARKNRTNENYSKFSIFLAFKHLISYTVLCVFRLRKKMPPLRAAIYFCSLHTFTWNSSFKGRECRFETCFTAAAWSWELMIETSHFASCERNATNVNKKRTKEIFLSQLLTFKEANKKLLWNSGPNVNNANNANAIKFQIVYWFIFTLYLSLTFCCCVFFLGIDKSFLLCRPEFF
jgi:hypothetical protein